VASGTPDQKPKPVRGPWRTPRQVARRLGVSVQTVIRYFEMGELPATDLSPVPLKRRKRRLLRFQDDDVERLEERRARAAGIQAAGETTNPGRV
jgi:predicted site-specific integrase-resolvase